MNNKTNIITYCAFCENKFRTEEEFGIDYKLIAWTDDPEDLDSLNKLGKCVHTKCFNKFIELNINIIIDFIISRLTENKLAK